MLTDIEIAQQAKMKPITEIADGMGLTEDDLELYGKYKAKVSLECYEKLKAQPDGKLILVTAINPTPAGEGKSTTTVGLGQALHQMGKKTVIALREPSLGPCLGVKGGAAGGGYSQVVPMEDINLHFTGDIHAITTAHNFLAAALDNHIHQGNTLKIDVRRIVWKRVVDLNDRALRHVVVSLGGKPNGFPREDGFDITVASEIMAILCLASGMDDLKERLSKIIVAYDFDGEVVTADDLKVAGSLTLLLKDAIKPNLVQTLENVPAFIHGGPFANIAHGCNSVMATKMAMKLGDYVVTEAGFGADLGAEKFYNIKCRYAGLKPDATVVVATIRALKMHGGVNKKELEAENLDALDKGFVNLQKHIENVRKFGVPVIVAVNEFPTDTTAEIESLQRKCREMNVPVAHSQVWAKGGEGGIELAEKLLELMEKEKSQFHVLYDEKSAIPDKIKAVATEVYGAAEVAFSKKALQTIGDLEKKGLSDLPICIAKTQYSLSDDPTLLGRPSGFTVTVSEIKISQGAGFIVALTGGIMTMPGLPKKPAAENMDIDGAGKITGLF